MNNPGGIDRVVSSENRINGGKCFSLIVCGVVRARCDCHCRERADDCDNHQKFNKGEAALRRPRRDGGWRELKHIIEPCNGCAIN